jgi:molybdopterin synthase catalytic subunit
MVRETERALVEVTDEPLHMDRYVEFVGDPGAGAISSFVGVTRNTFGGKEVLRLEYEAYAPMAEKELMKLCTQVRQPDLCTGTSLSLCGCGRRLGFQRAGRMGADV